MKYFKQNHKVFGKKWTISSIILSAIFIALFILLEVFITKATEGIVKYVVIVFLSLFPLFIFILGFLPSFINLIVLLFGEKLNANIVSVKECKPYQHDSGDAFFNRGIEIIFSINNNSYTNIITYNSKLLKTLKINDNISIKKMGKIYIIDVDKLS